MRWRRSPEREIEAPDVMLLICIKAADPTPPQHRNPGASHTWGQKEGGRLGEGGEQGGREDVARYIASKEEEEQEGG